MFKDEEEIKALLKALERDVEDEHRFEYYHLYRQAREKDSTSTFEELWDSLPINVSKPYVTERAYGNTIN